MTLEVAGGEDCSTYLIGNGASFGFCRHSVGGEMGGIHRDNFSGRDNVAEGNDLGSEVVECLGLVINRCGNSRDGKDMDSLMAIT